LRAELSAQCLEATWSREKDPKVDYQNSISESDSRKRNVSETRLQTAKDIRADPLWKR
jgi:hypothetical protein